jgi:hypothetical protein
MELNNSLWNQMACNDENTIIVGWTRTRGVDINRETISHYELKNFIATFLITVKRPEIFYLPTSLPDVPRAHRPVPSLYELRENAGC